MEIGTTKEYNYESNYQYQPESNAAVADSSYTYTKYESKIDPELEADLKRYQWSLINIYKYFDYWFYEDLVMIKRIATSFCTQKGTRLFLFAGQGTQEVGMLNSIEQKDREDGLALASRLLGVDMAEIVTKDEKKVIN